MPEQELNLLQLSAGGAAEASATSAEIMRREFAHANLGGEFLDDVPHQLFGNSFAPDLPALTPAAVVQAVSRPCTQSGTGIVRT